MRCRIDPLTVTETKELIEYRLKVAGTNEEIFNPRAIDEIFSFSEGYPRLINIICDQAMLTGYGAGKRIIDVKTIKECAELHAFWQVLACYRQAYEQDKNQCGFQ